MSHGKLFVGIDGGASFSRLVVLNSEGDHLAEVDIAATVSPYFLTPELSAQRIDAMLMSAAEKMNLARAEFLNRMIVVGLGISGCENPSSQQSLKDALYAIFGLSRSSCHIAVCSDSLSTALTAFQPQLGGTILISGTGSNCLLLIPTSDTSKSLNLITCGGWGSNLGDYGSAYWVALEATRHVIEQEDCFTRFCNACSTDCSSFDRKCVSEAVATRFGNSKLSDLFEIFGPKFAKANISRLTSDLAELSNQDDALAKHLFYEAGRHLAAMVLGVVKRVVKLHGKENFQRFIAKSKNRFEIACTGSMFKSWKFLKPGFMSVLNLEAATFKTEYNILAICMRRLCCSASVGAAIFASITYPGDADGRHLSIDWSLNSVIFENILL